MAGVAGVAVAICLHMLNRVRDDLVDPKTRRDELNKLRSPGFVATYRGWLAAVLDRLDGWFGERLFFHWRGVSICAGIAMVYTLVFFVAGWGFGGPGGLGPDGFMGKTDDPSGGGWLAAAFVTSLAVLGIAAWKREVIDAWFWARARRLLPGGWPEWLVRGVVAVVFGVSMFGVLYGLLGVNGAVAFALALAFAGVGAIAFAIAFAGAVAVAVAFVIAYAVFFFTVFEDTGTGALSLAIVYVFAFAYTLAFAFAFAAAFAVAFADSVSDPGFLVFVLFFLLLPIVNGFLDYLSLSVSRRLGRHLLGKREKEKERDGLERLVRASSTPQQLAMRARIILLLKEKEKEKEKEKTIRIRTILGHTAIDLAAAAVLLAALAFVVPWVVQSFNLIFGPSEGGEPLPLKPLLARVSADDASVGDRLWVGGMLFSTLVPTAAHLAILWTGLFALVGRWRPRIIKILQKPPDPHPDRASAAELTVAARYLVLRWAEGAFAAVATIMALVAFYGLFYDLIGSMAEHLLWVAERGIAFAEILFD